MKDPVVFTLAEYQALVRALPDKPDRYEETMTPPKEVLDLAWSAVKKIKQCIESMEDGVPA